MKENEQRIEQLKSANARLKKKISEKARKIDTRRKIVAGAVVLKHAQIDQRFGAELHKLLESFVGERDRHLFDLPPNGGKG
jgi:hypothetical protein